MLWYFLTDRDEVGQAREAWNSWFVPRFGRVRDGFGSTIPIGRGPEGRRGLGRRRWRKGKSVNKWRIHLVEKEEEGETPVFGRMYMMWCNC